MSILRGMAQNAILIPLPASWSLDEWTAMISKAQAIRSLLSAEDRIKLDAFTVMPTRFHQTEPR